MKIRQLTSERPAVYADMNVYRYIAHGELQIANAEEFLWVYSYVHLDEIARSASTITLEGMRRLKAVEICDVLSDAFVSAGNVAFLQYVDPDERYQAHLDAISGYGDASDFMAEYLLSFLAQTILRSFRNHPRLCEEKLRDSPRDCQLKRGTKWRSVQTMLLYRWPR